MAHKEIIKVIWLVVIAALFINVVAALIVNSGQWQWLFFIVAAAICITAGVAWDYTKKTKRYSVGLHSRRLGILTVLLSVLTIAGFSYVIPLMPPVFGPKVLYLADWSNDMNGWYGVDATATTDWQTNGGWLKNDGQNVNFNLIQAPYSPGAKGIANYAVEARVRFREPRGLFSIYVRCKTNACPANGYSVTITDQNAAIWAQPNQTAGLAYQNYVAGTEWHNYRVEVQDTHIRLLIDGKPVVEAESERYQRGGWIGLEDANAPIDISNFKVLTLY